MKIKYRFSNGFTLIELLVVIAIMGILAAAITPTVSHYLPGIQLNGSARNISSDLRDAQEKSITEQKQYLLRFHPTNFPPTYEVIRINNSVEESQKQVTLPSSEQILIDSTISNNQIIFSPDGGPSSSGNITLTINSVNKIVNVSPAGFVKIQ